MRTAEARPRRADRTERLSDDQIRRSWAHIVAVSLVLALGIAVVTFLAINVVSERRARDDAKARAALVAAVVGAYLEASDDTAGHAELAAAVDAVAKHARVSHVVAWRRDGSVVWADDSTMIGQRYRLGPELRDVFASTTTLVGRPDPVDLEGADTPPGATEDLEVFSPANGADGEPFVVESYITRSSRADHRLDTLRAVWPFVAVVMLVLEGLLLALGGALVSQVRRSRQERTDVTVAALRTVELERRELAHGLHDGIVQDLAATRYALASISETLPSGLAHDPQGRLRRIHDVLGTELQDLRALLGHLVPPDLEVRSLEQALSELVGHLVPAGIRCDLTVTPCAVSSEEAHVVHRLVREGVANVVKHAEATEIRVQVSVHPPVGPGSSAEVSVLVEDDGRGLERRVRSDPSPHFGLELVTAMVRDHGGSVAVTERDAAGGARLLARFPTVATARP